MTVARDPAAREEFDQRSGCWGRRVLHVNRLVLAFAVPAFFLGSPAWPQDEGQREAQAKTAQIITLAKVAPLLCLNLKADENAIRDLEEHTDVSEQDIMDPKVFGVQDELIAHSFTKSFRDNGVQTCADIAATLGPDGAKLVRRKTGAPG